MIPRKSDFLKRVDFRAWVSASLTQCDLTVLLMVPLIPLIIMHLITPSKSYHKGNWCHRIKPTPLDEPFYLIKFLCLAMFLQSIDKWELNIKTHHRTKWQNITLWYGRVTLCISNLFSYFVTFLRWNAIKIRNIYKVI